MPIVSDLDAAMMQPALSVPAIRRLGGGSIRLNDAGRPLRIVGRDVVVYELRTPDGRILALRCFLRPDPRRDATLATRYATLGSDPRLEGLRGRSGALPRDIRWISEGVALPGPDLRQEMAPLMAMERVPGRTLARAVDRLCREGQTEPLALLADAWLATATALELAGFSHGDLAADNLIVRPDGSIALVDLDSAMWPSAGEPSISSAGTPGYAHPHGAPLDPARRDRFPALILWASLRILARYPHLRDRWGDSPENHGPALLFSLDDLRHPARSALLSALDALDDEQLVPLLEVVRRALRFAPDDTPPLPEIADRLAGLGLPRFASSGPIPRRILPASDHFTSAPGPNAGPQNGEVVPPWPGEPDVLPSTGGERFGYSPDTLPTTTLSERDRRRAAARELADAVKTRDTAAAVRLWEETRTIPEVANYAASVHLLVAHDATAAIDRAIRRLDDHGLVAAVAEAERAGVAPSTEARAAVRAARKRIAARAALREAMEREDLHALGLLKRSGRLDCLGRLDVAHSRAVERALAWPALERALASDDDAAIVAAADPSLWREEAFLPPEARQRLELARLRLRWTEDVRAALRLRDGPALRGLLTNAPPGAEQRLSEVESRRILRISMREAAVARLERALREGPDREVVAALAEFESAGAPFSDVLDWTAVRGVVDRLSLADAIREATAADPPDTARLARLLPAARAALGGSSAEEGPDWAALEQSVLRAAHVARLREALAANDDAAIASAATPDPYDARSLLNEAERERVGQALVRRSR